MEDSDVVEALIAGERASFGPNLHIEGDVLSAFGWFHIGFRLSPNAFIVRNDDGEEETALIKVIEKQLESHGLKKVREDHPLVQAISYTEMSLAGPTWAIWSTDQARGDSALAARVGADTIPRGMLDEDTGEKVGDFSADLEQARRVAGLPASVILSVGLDKDQLQALKIAMPECRFEEKAFGEIRPEACGTLTPQLALIDCTTQTGRNFLMELRAVACGRFLPIAAVSVEGTPAGADAGLDPSIPPGNWKGQLTELLPS